MQGTMAGRIREAREAAGLTQAEVARRVGVSKQAVGQWESGDTRSIRGDNLLALARVLGRQPGEFSASGRVGAAAVGSGAPGPPGPWEVPLVTWRVAALWHVGAGITLAGPSAKRVRTGRRVGRDAFALEVRDDAMAPLAPRGAVIVADPELGSPAAGDYVVATFEGDDEAVFRRYREEPGGPAMLVPLNDTYPPMALGPRDVFNGLVRVIQPPPPPEIVLK